MKKIYKINILIAFMALFAFHNIGTAQDTLDVAPFNDEGDLNLVPSIWGDTTETGERLNLNRVYRLQRGAVYVMNQTVFADFPIRLVADSDDDSQRPPILLRGAYESGDNIATFFTFTADNLRHSFKDIVFNGPDLNATYFGEWNKGLKVAGNGIKLSLDGCIMNAWSGLFLEITGNNVSVFIRDSKFRNGVGAQSPPWGAQQVVFNKTNHVDTVIMTNNTSFNTRGFIMDFEVGAVANYIQIEHNTFFTGAIDMLRMRDMTNADFRSNLFYGTHAYAQAESERKANWFDKDQEIISLFSIDTTSIALMNDIGLTEADKRVDLSNNTYFFPQPIKDWWANNPHLNTPVWMNSRTKAMFDNDTDFPFLNASNNIEADPLFTDTDMESWIIDELVTYCSNVRKDIAITSANYDEHTGLENLRFIPWPLPESLVYTNANMLNGGHDGLPVGDLNWYPEKKQTWEDALGVNDLAKIDFNLHPNPTTALLHVDTEDNMTELTIHNILGDKVYHLQNLKTNAKGIDISDLSNGLYFMSIKTNNGYGVQSFSKN